MEFDGLILLSRGFYMFYNGTPETNLTIITPHEISHQWFFSLVGNNQALEPWLDESLATYSEVLFYEHYYPELVPWWWENRVDGHQPSGFINNTIYLDQGYEAYRDSVYLNGAHFTQDLRETIGDEVFFTFLKAYVQQNRYEIATGEDFWRILQEHTDADLLPLIEEYFSEIPPSLQ
jgi:aminopeptidase N